MSGWNGFVCEYKATRAAELSWALNSIWEYVLKKRSRMKWMKASKCAGKILPAMAEWHNKMEVGGCKNKNVCGMLTFSFLVTFAFKTLLLVAEETLGESELEILYFAGVLLLRLWIWSHVFLKGQITGLSTCRCHVVLHLQILCWSVNCKSNELNHLLSSCNITYFVYRN